MRVRRDNKLNAFNVKIGYEELQRAFKSTNNLLIFLHTLAALAYGDEFAQTEFPIMKGGKDES